MELANVVAAATGVGAPNRLTNVRGGKGEFKGAAAAGAKAGEAAADEAGRLGRVSGETSESSESFPQVRSPHDLPMISR